jgi:hypothetical protein
MTGIIALVALAAGYWYLLSVTASIADRLATAWAMDDTLPDRPMRFPILFLGVAPFLIGFLFSVGASAKALGIERWPDEHPILMVPVLIAYGFIAFTALFTCRRRFGFPVWLLLLWTAVGAMGFGMGIVLFR